MKRLTFLLFSLTCGVALFGLSTCRTLPVNPTGGSDTTHHTDSVFSAINGTVRRGPISPLERPGVDNTAPLMGAPIHITGQNGYSTTVVSDSVGKFFVKVSSGTYVLTPQTFTPSGLPRPKSPVTVRIARGDTESVQLDYDTGIR